MSNKLKYLKTPNSLMARFWGNLRAVYFAIFVFLLLLAINFVQMFSLIVIPFSRSAFRSINTNLANFWWGLCVFLMEPIYKMNVAFTGSKIPESENVILIANHQGVVDIPAIMTTAWRKRRLGNLKWFVKDSLKYMPGPGWGMLFLGCIFVKRNWFADKANIDKIFSRFDSHKIPIWLTSFLEGTRITDAKLKESQEFAASRNYKVMQNVMVPRTRGFCGAVVGLRDHIDAVYDVTIGYPGGVPSMWQLLQGFVSGFHVNIRRYPVADLPTSESELTAWVFKRYEEKDQLMAYFHEHNHFPGAVVSDPYRLTF